ncbi:MAG: hypothetical protein IPL26_24150 [Leptospiraceae bacterium]|nr:hypothetical protein [Leptospiraceae bacterium]
MSVEIIALHNFRKEAKRLIKKYHSLKEELSLLESELRQNPHLGVELKKNTYKIRLAVKSKGKGKSGGLRVITHIEIEFEVDSRKATKVYLLSIYDKSEYENISDNFLASLLKEASEED